MTKARAVTVYLNEEGYRKLQSIKLYLEDWMERADGVPHKATMSGTIRYAINVTDDKLLRDDADMWEWD